MRTRWPRKLIFSLLPLVVVLGSAELGLRAAGWPPPTGHFDHNSPYWVLDPDQRQAVIPHPEEQSTFLLSTDSHGLRAPLHDEPKAIGSTRIMALGCSTTLGWGVNDDQSYPARLEALGHAEGLSLEVVNGGQPGYTTFQGLWLWDTVLSSYNPDIVLIGYVVQDARRSAYTDRSQAVLSQDHRFLKDHLLWQSRVYLGLRALLGAVQVRAKERPTGSAPDDTSGVYRVPPAEYRDNLRALIARIRAIGARPVLLGYPLEVEGYTTTHRAVLAELSRSEDLPYLDLQPMMTAAAAERTLYFPQDRGHANAEGNDLIASTTLGWLERAGLLANPAQATH